MSSKGALRFTQTLDNERDFEFFPPGSRGKEGGGGFDFNCLPSHSPRLLQVPVDFAAPPVTITIAEEFGCALGSHVWDCSLALVEALLQADVSNKSVLELGSGCGLAGIASLKLCGASSVVVTEAEDLGVLMSLLRRNVAGVSPKLKAEPLSWSEDEGQATVGTSPFEFVVAADVLYDRNSWKKLLVTAHANLASSGSFLLTQKHRGDEDGDSDGDIESTRKAFIQDFLKMASGEGLFTLKEGSTVARVAADVDYLELKKVHCT